MAPVTVATVRELLLNFIGADSQQIDKVSQPCTPEKKRTQGLGPTHLQRVAAVFEAHRLLYHAA